VTLIEGQAEAVLPRLDERVTLSVIDPPRQGVKPQVLDALLRLAPRRLVYVSCNPSTLARDAAQLVRGGYKLVEVQPVDMFPQTYHVESVSLFEEARA
jgi:23S rRNA (uracil1939-C5)-methyltransferase